MNKPSSPVPILIHFLKNVRLCCNVEENLSKYYLQDVGIKYPRMNEKCLLCHILETFTLI